MARHSIRRVFGEPIEKMPSKKSYFFNYSTKYLQDLKNYYEELKLWEQFKDRVGEEGFCIIKKVFHPIYEYRANKEYLEKDELPFCDWILKKENIEKYNITKEKQVFFSQKRRKIIAELKAIGRLLSSLSRKWSLKL
jgi:hypothetical protein